MPAHEIVRRGIALVPEGRLLFPSLSVEENLRLGAYGKRAGPWRIERVHELFPVLRERRATPGTALSGGEQQMCAIGRALMSNPTLLLCDELSLGLAPVIIRQLYAVLPVIVSEGTTVVVVEQDINQALSVADRVYCFQEGRVSLQGRPDELLPRRRGHGPTSGSRGGESGRAMEWLDAIIQGVLLGGLYALFATGLSLIFGVMRLVNIAHGDLIVLAAFLGLAMVNGTGVHPLLSLIVTVPVMAAIGYALQRGILNLTLGRDILPPLLVTFGLSIIIQNVLLEVFSADTQRLKAGALETASIAIGE